MWRNLAYLNTVFWWALTFALVVGKMVGYVTMHWLLVISPAIFVNVVSATVLCIYLFSGSDNSEDHKD